jgi:hypothetical protein
VTIGVGGGALSPALAEEVRKRLTPNLFVHVASTAAGANAMRVQIFDGFNPSRCPVTNSGLRETRETGATAPITARPPRKRIVDLRPRVCLVGKADLADHSIGSSVNRGAVLIFAEAKNPHSEIFVDRGRFRLDQRESCPGQ